MVVHIAPKIIRLVAVKEIREDGVRSWEASQPLLQDRIVDVCDPEIIIDVPCTASKKSPERYILSKGVSPLQVPGPKLLAGSSSDPPTIPTDCPQPGRAFHLECFICIHLHTSHWKGLRTEIYSSSGEGEAGGSQPERLWKKIRVVIFLSFILTLFGF